MKIFKFIMIAIWMTNPSFSQDLSYESSRFGIFGAYALEYRWFMQQMGFDDQDYWNWVDEHFANLGAYWTRSNTQLIWTLVDPNLDGISS